MTTMVLKYGVRSILEHRDEAHDEMHAAHRYYNALMEITRNRELALREVMVRYVPEIAAVEAELAAVDSQIDLAYEAIRKARKKARAKLEPTAEQKQLLADLKGARPALWERRRKAAKQFHALVNDSRMAFDARTSGAPTELLEQIKEIGRQLREAKKQRNNPDVAALAKTLTALKKRKKDGAPATHKKAAANASTLEAMLGEPEWHPAWKEQKQIEAKAHAQTLLLRKGSGLTQGTYAAVEGAVEQALDTAKDLPRFCDWDCGRKIGRQIQAGKNPLTGAKVMAGTDARLQVVSREPLRGRKDDAQRVERGPASGRSHWEYAIVKLPIGKGTERKALSLEVLLHRPIPADAVVTWAYLVPRRRGTRVVYTLQLTVNVERGIVQRQYGEGECVVRLRWSRERCSDADADRRGIVVAEIDGQEFAMDGSEYRDMTPSPRHGAYAGMRFSRLHRHYLDEHFCGSKEHPERGAQAKLVDWMSRNPDLTPDWLRAATAARAKTETERGQASLGEWRDPRRLFPVVEKWLHVAGLDGPPVVAGRARSRIQELWVAWKQARDAAGLDYHTQDLGELREWLSMQEPKAPGRLRDPDTELQVMGVWLEWWRRKIVHLATVEADLRSKALGNRKQQYRRKAAELARAHGSVAVYEIDLADSAKRKLPGGDKDELWQQARYQRVCAAPSEFKEALKLAFGKDRYREIKRERASAAPGPGGARETPNEPENKEGRSDRPVAAE